MKTEDFAHLQSLAEDYTAAWCSQQAASVAAFYAEDGLLQVNDASAAVGRAAITEVAQSFMTAFPDMQVLLDNCAAKATARFTLGRWSARTPGQAAQAARCASVVMKSGSLVQMDASPVHKVGLTPRNITDNSKGARESSAELQCPPLTDTIPFRNAESRLQYVPEAVSKSNLTNSKTV